ncbi:MAG: hypothetical protein HOI95_14395 [Chromatiales bacterium]|jgi:hypothetical protein|nr:hypothetical protein [Chromatiales bacterium]
MSEPNWLAVMVGAFATVAFGALWCSPIGLLNLWARESGTDPKVCLRVAQHAFF